MRGVSTVVDATVFLLLVGAAIATLVAGTGGVTDDGRNPAAADARLLASTTATVNYSLTPPPGRADLGVEFRRTDGPEFERAAHGTLASLLADAAVGSAAVGNRRLSHQSRDFQEHVESTVENRTRRTHEETSVSAVWEPYPGAPLTGAVQVGDEPPRDADVHAATIEPESGVPDPDCGPVRAARDGGYAGLARTVADAVVEGLFPPNETRVALRSEYPVDALTAHRYRRTASAVDAKRPGVSEVPVTESNDRLAAALADALERDMRARYDSPEAAAADADVTSVRITVRTWSP